MSSEDNIFQAEQCDAFDSDVDEAPTAHTMFMANLSSADPYHEEHEMQNDVQPNDVVDSDTEYTSNSISYEQYVQNNEAQVVQSNVSSVPNDALMMIINDIDKQPAQCVPTNKQNKAVNESLTRHSNLTLKNHITHPHCEAKNRVAESRQSSMSQDGSIFVYNPDVLHEQFA
ncbi:hypothetical protein Tco_0967466, partial [Tanacetum coccineum]